MKCIKCYREIDEGIKFCIHCGTMQPADREAYEREHPELATAISDEELNKLIEDKSSEMQQSGPMTPPVPPVMPPTVDAGTMQQPPQPPQYPAATPPQYNGNTPTHENWDNDSNEAPNKNMLQCPECGHMVDAESNSCPNCGCPFVLPSDQWQDDNEPLPTQGNNEPYYYEEESKKKGMSGWAKGLIAFAVTLLLAAAGGAVYYFFFMENVKKLNVDPEEVMFTRKGGKKKITVDTDAKEFKIVKSPEWAKVEITGDDEITITCQPLDDNASDREDIIRITAGDKREKITIKQSAKATYLKVDNSYRRLSVGHSSEEVEIPIDTDGDPSQFEYQCKSEYGSTPDWMYISNKTKSGITVTLEENSYSSSRNAEITITSGKHSESILIRQNGKCGYCDGTGRRDCSNCYGSGQVTCYNCNYEGQVQIGYDDGYPIFRNCPECGGDQKKRCDQCNGHGNKTCEYCNGTGECE